MRRSPTTCIPVYRWYTYSIHIVLAVLLMGGTVGAYNHKNLSAQSFPYTVLSNDSITIDGNASTHTTLSISGSGINIGNSVTHVFINFGSDTLLFDNDNSSTSGSPEYGIKIGLSPAHSSAPNDIIITSDTSTGGYAYGVLRTTDVAGHGYLTSTTPSSRRSLWLKQAYNAIVKRITILSDGHSSQCIYLGAGSMSDVIIERDTIRNWCQSYPDRQTYGGAAILGGAIYESDGSYTIKWRHNYIESNGHAGIATEEALFRIDTNYFLIGAKNTYWDTMPCYPSCAIGQSAANAYAILARHCENGSWYVGNTILSANSGIGSRGILIDGYEENARTDDSIHIIGNTIDTHEGPHGEEGADGETRAVRIRGFDAGVSAGANVTTVILSGNDVTVTADSASGTGYIGTNGVCLHVGCFLKDSNTTRASNNTFRVKALNKYTGLNAEPIFISGDVNVNGRGIYFSGNKFIGSNSILRLADASNNANGIVNAQFDGDTVAYCDTIADNGLEIIGNPPYTYNVGISTATSTGNVIKNLTYQTISGYTNQASDTNILFTGSGAANISIIRTVTMTVLGNNGYPVPSAAARVYHSYDINGPTAIYSGTTDANGKFIPDVKYWYEANTTTDSTTFNPFRFVAVSGADSASTDYTVSPTNIAVTVTLTGTAGTPPAGAVKSFKGATMKGTKLP